MAHTDIPFARPIATAGLAGFPDALTAVAQARSVVEAARLPAIRSGFRWLDADRRLTLAAATGSPAHIEAARLALSLAVAGEGRSERHGATLAQAA